MQIFWPGGILMPALRPPHTVPVGDNRLIQVRARRREHLWRLKERYLPELGDVIQLPHTDYEYRAYCTHEQLASALALMALDIDYIKSKSQAVEQYQDNELYETNNAVWGTLFNKLSSARRFWTGSRTVSTSSKKGSAKRPWWEDARDPGDQVTVADLVGQDADEMLTDMVPKEWDNEIPEVTRKPNGDIDHSYCKHPNSKNAKRRCTRRHNNHR